MVDEAIRLKKLYDTAEKIHKEELKTYGEMLKERKYSPKLINKQRELVALLAAKRKMRKEKWDKGENDEKSKASDIERLKV